MIKKYPKGSNTKIITDDLHIMVIFPLIVNEFIQSKPIYAMHLKTLSSKEPYFGKFGRIELDAPENSLLLDIITTHGLTNFAVFVDFVFNLAETIGPAVATKVTNEGEMVEVLSGILDKVKKVS